MLLNKEQVIKVLPHRDPFLFIDTVEYVKLPEGKEGKKLVYTKELPGTEVKAHFKVPEDLVILKGHFPGNPILPGVVQCEMMAQASAFVCLAFDFDLNAGGVETLLLGVDNSRFRKPIVPNMELEIYTKVTKVRGTFAQYESYIMSGGEKISECTFMATLKMKG